MNEIHNPDRFVEELLQWYDENKRILPWRENPRPYDVWVSEIMLQQTRVEAVKPYFERFLTALPNIEALANCEEEDLHKLWEGLGYYNRVRNMKKCAMKCMEDYDGELPNTYEELLTLPGIGSYTAGAIASIAFHELVPAVDGNVLRVFSRVLVSEEDILKESTKKHFQSVIQDYLPKRVDAFNQALMELGATICVPNGAPRCNICPVTRDCLGYQSGKANALPIKKAKKSRRIEKHTICVIVCKDQVHLIKRPTEGLLASLYQFDMLEEYLNKTQAIEYASKHASVTHCRALPASKHIFSHIEWHMKGWLIQVEETTSNETWANIAEIESRFAIATAFKVYKDACLAYLKGEAQ